MSIPHTPKSRVLALASAVAGLLVCSAARATAQEYCVACTGPDVLYRCVIEGTRPGLATSLPMLCIGTLAREGAHATCAIRRDVGVIDCNGPVRRIAIPADGLPASIGQPTPPTPAVTPAPPAPGTPASAPKTVEEMLQRAKSDNDKAWAKTDAQIRSNNEKIGGFFKRSWDCVSSLFARCGE